MSKPMIPKEIGKGALIFLIGTSTAGKTTLCSEIINQDKDLPADQQRDWQVWGDDLERKWLDEEGNKELKEDKKNANTPRGWNERAFDRAIEASKAGKSMILDTFLDHADGDVIWDHFKKYSESKNFTCPTRVVFLHVPVAELTNRITNRNLQAEAEGGDRDNIRLGINPFKAYAELYGAYDETGLALNQNLSRKDVCDAVDKLGCDKKNGFQESNNLLEKLGFKDGDESIPLGTKEWKPDVVYDHSKISTTDIATEIRALAVKAIQEQSEHGTQSPSAAEGKKIAEEVNKTLEREKSKKSSEEVVSSGGSPTTSPRSTQPALSFSPAPQGRDPS